MAEKEQKSGKGLLLLLLLLGGAGAVLALSSKKTTNGKPSPPSDKHKVCSGGKCIDTVGVGTDECSETKPCPVPGVSHKECDGAGKCIVKNVAGDNKCTLDGDCPNPNQHKECDGNGKCIVIPGAGNNKCEVDGECPIPVKHNVCQSGKCVAIDGFAPNDCWKDGDCPPTPPDHHTECNKQTGKCEDVFGFGKDLCTSDNQCLVTHKGCQEGKCVDLPGLGLDECTKDEECTCASYCGEITKGGCSCKDGCEAQGNCCYDKSTLCNSTAQFKRVLIVACSSSINDMSRGQKLKDNMVGQSNDGWVDGTNVFTAFVSKLSSLSTIINNTDPEAIVVLGGQLSWNGCDFNLWQNYFNDINSSTDYANMVQTTNEGGVLFIGLAGYTNEQSEKIVDSFTSYAGYVADELNFGTGKAPSNFLAFKPSYLMCKDQCGDNLLPPYCYCDTQCKNFGDCCYDYEGFCP